jgi:hypothetical protein
LDQEGTARKYRMEAGRWYSTSTTKVTVSARDPVSLRRPKRGDVAGGDYGSHSAPAVSECVF